MNACLYLFCLTLGILAGKFTIPVSVIRVKSEVGNLLDAVYLSVKLYSVLNWIEADFQFRQCKLYRIHETSRKTGRLGWPVR